MLGDDSFINSDGSNWESDINGQIIEMIRKASVHLGIYDATHHVPKTDITTPLEIIEVFGRHDRLAYSVSAIEYAKAYDMAYYAGVGFDVIIDLIERYGTMAINFIPILKFSDLDDDEDEDTGFEW